MVERGGLDVIRTELEWGYQPQGFFEERFVFALSDGELVAEVGKATLTLASPTNPVLAADLQRCKDETLSVFEIHQLTKHRSFELNGPATVQYTPDGGRRVAVSVTSTGGAVAGGPADCVFTDANGVVVRDTKAERLASEMAMVISISPKLAHSSILSGMLRSYGQAVRDPQNELIHLYEIRDAIAKVYGGERDAITALGIKTSDWKALGRLANEEPLREGRHRGKKFDELRSATQGELAEARRITCSLIKAYANCV